MDVFAMDRTNEQYDAVLRGASGLSPANSGSDYNDKREDQVFDEKEEADKEEKVGWVLPLCVSPGA
jgi:hypothetical protein